MAKEAIGEIVASGVTSIGAGLLAAYKELVGSGRGGVPGSIVLLSDGEENTAPWVDDLLRLMVERGIRVFAVGLGDGGDEALCMRIAERTGGPYRLSPSPRLRLRFIKRFMAEVRDFKARFPFST